ncbi:hypothetical protein [Planctomycetes bacterium TBK1r]|uniref:Phage-related minor tail protein n=1 Tax=Stieleria magnilauensis TaxID=2527963 RepID=A0ABX5XZG7_9BACT|nr:hypothetical protein TBK1r_62050 [Planctomycetes bacterium TBK1r]
MSEQIVVKLKGDEKDLVQAFQKSEKAQGQLTKSIGAFGEHAKKAAAEAVAAVKKTDAAIVDLDKVVGKAGRNLAGLPKSVRDQFKELAKETGVSRGAFEKIDQTIDQLRQTTSLTEGQLERMRQKLKKAAEAAEMEKAAKQNKRNVDSIVRNISRISPEMQAVVDAANSDLSKIGSGGERSIENMLTRLRKIGPEGERQANAIEKRFKQSLEAVEKEFKGPLDELRALGPAGQKAADKVKREFVISGTVSEAAMKKIVGPLGNLSAQAATVAANVQKELSGAADKSTKSWLLFATRMTGALGGVAAVTQGIRTAITEVNKALERQAELRAAAKNANTDLATIQATALQNLTGLAPEVQNDLIDAAPRKIAGDTGTGLLGVKELAEAAGIVMSSGVSKPEVIKEVMAASAEVMQLSPDSISEFAKAVAGAMKASGQQDDASAVRNTASAIIAGMKGSGVTDLGSFAKTAPRALASGALASDGGKMASAIGAFDALAIAGAASQKTGDDAGDRSSTFAAQMAGKLDEYFARPEVLKRFKGQAPGTPLARLQAIHRMKLQDDFQAVSGAFGDATFKGVIEDLLRGGEVFQDVMRTRKDIWSQMSGAEAGSYAATLIKQQAGLQPTLPMNVSKASKSGESAGELATLDATGKAVSQASLDIVKSAVKATEDTMGESVDLLAKGYRPNPLMEWLGFGGSIERDGFGGSDLQNVVRAHDFLQRQQRRYHTKQIEVSDGAETLGIRSKITVDRPLAEIPDRELREAQAFKQAAAANEKLLADLSVFPRREVQGAYRDLQRIQREQTETFRRDGSLSPIERDILAKNNELLEKMLDVLNRSADAAEATAEATYETAGNTARGADPASAQRAANEAR